MIARLAALAAALAAAGCKNDRETPSPASLAVAPERAVKIGPVGFGSDAAPATYALVDVTNTGDRDVTARVGGELFDVAGNSLGRTRPETLRIAAGETRMFALVDGERRALDNAVHAEVAIEGASFAHAAARVLVTGVTNHSDQGRAVVAGYLENRGEGAVTAMVIAGFYDAAGAPVERMASAYRIDGKSRRAVQHVGPVGSARGALFVGDFN